MSNAKKNTATKIPQNVLDLMSSLSHTKQVFLREYLTQTTRNAKQAYLAAKPGTGGNSAGTMGHRMLTAVDVQGVIRVFDADCNALSLAKGVAKRENLIQKAYKVYENAEGKEQYGVALQGIDLTAKLNRLYEKDREDPGNWQTLVQNIMVVNNNAPVDNTPIIDVDLDKDEESQGFVTPDA